MSALPETGVCNDALGDEPILVLSEKTGGAGPGLPRAYSRRLDGTVLELEPAGPAEPRPDAGPPAVARDRATGSLWALTGRAVAGPLAGAELEPLPQFQAAFWFAWAWSHPETEVAAADGE